MKTSEKTSQLFSAMHKAITMIQPVVKDANNPYFKSKYATLGAHLHAIREPLSVHGLVLTQLPIPGGLCTRLTHESGEYIEADATIEGLPNDPQKYGSALTYLRRYAIAALFNIDAEDDDANLATQPASVSPKVNNQQNYAGNKVAKKADKNELITRITKAVLLLGDKLSNDEKKTYDGLEKLDTVQLEQKLGSITAVYKERMK